MDEQTILALLDNVVSLAILLFVWQLERRRSERFENKHDDLVQVFVDEHKVRSMNGKHDSPQ